ncbi:DUF192 domain-containing protein [Rhizobium sp. SSA_523]|uniref:DUF192 domain-containing protein n=1 Tax=Rhizobium sp. SSA_523 TaxID=2952477 RepID=UPI0020906009|nr:DUF192 domain-containing protein [Rhizobium sp. SSA_523]MCO5734086.1 DUF192 domain-containing protein [Rhizobium sp. SSA_523]WKC24724.1 DUF192 domain-containing protein [Rhizobium sp. SSA_523]
MRHVHSTFLGSAVLALLLFAAVPLVSPANHAVSAAEIVFSTEPLAIRTADGKRHAFTVELALDAQERQQGLMYRRTMAADHGMLFDFGVAREVTMWMRNTLLPLDMLFIDRGGRITHIHEGAEPLSEAIISSNGPITYVLELNAGEVAKRGIKVGDQIESRQIGTAG